MTHCLEPPVSVPDGDGKENVANQSPPHDQEAEGKGKRKDWGPGIPKDLPLGLTPLEVLLHFPRWLYWGPNF